MELDECQKWFGQSSQQQTRLFYIKYYSFQWKLFNFQIIIINRWWEADVIICASCLKQNYKRVSTVV